MAKVTAVTAGSPSGMVATASATARFINSTKPLPRINPMAKTSTTMTAESNARLCARPLSCLCNGVSSGAAPFNNPAMRPISVDIPVLVTTISARPRVTVVFMNAMQ